MNKRTILKFYAPWCGPCKAVDAIFDKLGNDIFEDKNIEIKNINTEDNINLAQKYKVRAIPHLILLDENEKILKEKTGLTDEDEILDFIKER